MSVCLREIETSEADGFVSVRYCISVVTNFDDGQYTDKAVDMALKCDYECEKAKTQKKWEKFFSASKVNIEDKENDIFVSKVELSAANALEKEAAATCALTFVTPKGTYFDDNDLSALDKLGVFTSVRLTG